MPSTAGDPKLCPSPKDSMPQSYAKMIANYLEYHPRNLPFPVNIHLTSSRTAHLISFTRVILPVLMFLGN